MKKIFCLIVAMLLIASQFSFAVFAQETDEEKIERVYDEVISGNISSVEDVLDFIRQVVTPDRCALSVITPIKEEEG